MTTIIRRKMPYYPVFKSFHTERENDRRKDFAPLNIIENDNVYMIELNLAGWQKEDIDMKIEDDTLIISGERKAEATEGNQYHLQEFDNQRFYRSLILNDSIDQESIGAELKDGILKIELKKISEEELKGSKKIEIR